METMMTTTTTTPRMEHGKILATAKFQVLSVDAAEERRQPITTIAAAAAANAVKKNGSLLLWSTDPLQLQEKKNCPQYSAVRDDPWRAAIILLQLAAPVVVHSNSNSSSSSTHESSGVAVVVAVPVVVVDEKPSTIIIETSDYSNMATPLIFQNNKNVEHNYADHHEGTTTSTTTTTTSVSPPPPPPLTTTATIKPCVVDEQTDGAGTAAPVPKTPSLRQTTTPTTAVAAIAVVTPDDTVTTTVNKKKAFFDPEQQQQQNLFHRYDYCYYDPLAQPQCCPVVGTPKFSVLSSSSSSSSSTSITESSASRRVTTTIRPAATAAAAAVAATRSSSSSKAPLFPATTTTTRSAAAHRSSSSNEWQSDSLAAAFLLVSQQQQAPRHAASVAGQAKTEDTAFPIPITAAAATITTTGSFVVVVGGAEEEESGEPPVTAAAAADASKASSSSARSVVVQEKDYAEEEQRLSSGAAAAAEIVPLSNTAAAAAAIAAEVVHTCASTVTLPAPPPLLAQEDEEKKDATTSKKFEGGAILGNKSTRQTAPATANNKEALLLLLQLAPTAKFHVLSVCGGNDPHHLVAAPPPPKIAPEQTKSTTRFGCDIMAVANNKDPFDFVVSSWAAVAANLATVQNGAERVKEASPLLLLPMVESSASRAAVLTVGTPSVAVKSAKAATAAAAAATKVVVAAVPDADAAPASLQTVDTRASSAPVPADDTSAPLDRSSSSSSSVTETTQKTEQSAAVVVAESSEPVAVVKAAAAALAEIGTPEAVVDVLAPAAAVEMAKSAATVHDASTAAQEHNSEEVERDDAAAVVMVVEREMRVGACDGTAAGDKASEAATVLVSSLAAAWAVTEIFVEDDDDNEIAIAERKMMVTSSSEVDVFGMGPKTVMEDDVADNAVADWSIIVTENETDVFEVGPRETAAEVQNVESELAAVEGVEVIGSETSYYVLDDEDKVSDTSVEETTETVLEHSMIVDERCTSVEVEESVSAVDAIASEVIDMVESKIEFAGISAFKEAKEDVLGSNEMTMQSTISQDENEHVENMAPSIPAMKKAMEQTDVGDEMTKVVQESRTIVDEREAVIEVVESTDAADTIASEVVDMIQSEAILSSDERTMQTAISQDENEHVENMAQSIPAMKKDMEQTDGGDEKTMKLAISHDENEHVENMAQSIPAMKKDMEQTDGGDEMTKAVHERSPIEDERETVIEVVESTDAVDTIASEVVDVVQSEAVSDEKTMQLAISHDENEHVENMAPSIPATEKDIEQTNVGDGRTKAGHESSPIVDERETVIEVVESTDAGDAIASEVADMVQSETVLCSNEKTTQAAISQDVNEHVENKTPSTAAMKKDIEETNESTITYGTLPACSTSTEEKVELNKTAMATPMASENHLESSLPTDAAPRSIEAPVVAAEQLMSYADMAKKPYTENATSGAPNIPRSKGQAKEKDAEMKKDVAETTASSEKRTSRFVPSLGGVVRTAAAKGGVDVISAVPKQSTTAAIEPYVLVLTSSMLRRESTTNQQKAMAVLDSKSVAYKIVDEADPANKEECNELFVLSGLRGEYPQFFHVDVTGIPAFWGNFEHFNNAQENGTLARELGGKVDSVSENLRLTAQPTVGPPESSLVTPKSKSVLLLISNQSLNREVTVQQSKVMSILDVRGMPYETVDGADPVNKDRRNELFGLSGLRGQYPQIFLVEGSATCFWGDWNHFEHANEEGKLAMDLGNKPWEGNLDKAEYPVEIEKEAVTQSTGGASNDVSMLVLVSNQSFIREVAANQEKAFAILSATGIAYETVDGADPANKDVRENLFKISGIRAQYPQFFLVQYGEMDFWGDWNRLEACNEDRSLIAALGPTPCARRGEAPPTVRVESKKPYPEAFPPNATATAGLTKHGNGKATPTEASAAAGAQSAEKSSVSQGTVKGIGGKDGSAKIQRGLDIASDSKTASSIATGNSAAATEITIYGASSFVAKHALDYLMQVSLSLPGVRSITLAGRQENKLVALQATLTQKMANLRTVNPKSQGTCSFDVFVADSSDAAGLKTMAKRTKLVVNFAGPFAKLGENVVAACAQIGTDYIDITGEVTWAGQMRQKYSDAAEKSGARIVSFCGFDSVPSDLAVYAAVEALRNTNGGSVQVEDATCWHACAGLANGGTIHSAIGMPINFRRCFSQPVPFLLDDPLALTHPRTLVDPDNLSMKNRMAMVEWLNQLPSFDSILTLGVSASFFMAPVNAKIVNASAVALKYGPNFAYRERFLPLGIQNTRKFGLLSFIPAVCTQLAILLLAAVLMTPVLGKLLADWFVPPGSGAPDHFCKAGFAEVYSEVTSAPTSGGLVNRANCSIKFKGDPGNWVTAQCVSEAALALVLNKDDLPSRSKDGFGTPAEVLGSVLLKRLQATTVRPVKVATHARKNVVRNETVIFC